MLPNNRILSGSQESGNGRPHRRRRDSEFCYASWLDDDEGPKDRPAISWPPQPAIKITVNCNKVHYVTAEQLADEQATAAVLEECASAGEVSVILTKLPEFEGEDLGAAFDWLAKLPAAKFYSAAEDGNEDLFTSVVNLVPSNDDLEKYARGKAAALHCAAILHPTALECACQRILDRMRSLGVKGLRLDELVRDARLIVRDVRAPLDRSSRSIELPRVLEVLPDAPVSEDAVVPAGWELSANGVCSPDDGLCLPAPILIVGRGKDEATGSEMWRLAWYRDGVWHERVVNRADASTSRTIVELAEYGMPVTSNSASLLVDYLSDYETANLRSLSVTRVSSRLGFHGKQEQEVFLWGRNVITKKGIVEVGLNGGDTGGSGVKRDIIFRGADDGDEQLADSFHAAGDMESWRDAIRSLADSPMAKLALYAALTPPLLYILKSPNFCLDYSGDTTVGKTTALRVAASCWGYPDEDSNEKASVIRTWNATGVWTERFQAMLNHLPVILDDTKHAKHPDQVASTIYAVSQGKGRGRGTVKGTARQASFQTVLLSSGEQPATSFTQDGGVRARVLTLRGSPFGVASCEQGKVIRQLNRRICLHYGHAGPLFVKWLLARRKHWGKLVAAYQARVEVYEEWAGENPLALRMTTHFAALWVAMRFSHLAINLPWEPEDCVELLWDDLIGQIGDRVKAALRHAVDWATAHPDQFFANESKLEQPHGGWAGRWDRLRSVNDDNDSAAAWDWMGFIPQQLEKILREGGFEPQSSIRSWKDRGWLQCTTESSGAIRTTYRTRIGSESCRVVAITSAAVQEAEDQ